MTLCSLQVWIIADGVPGFPAETPGAVCHRLGVGPVQPKGQSWDYGIGVSLRSHSHDEQQYGREIKKRRKVNIFKI